MKISSIKLQRIESEKIKAVATITFDNFLTIRDIKLIALPDHMFCAMPQRKVPTGEYKDLCHPTTPEYPEYMDIINNAIIDLYNSSESERTFVGDYISPKMEVKIWPANNSESILAVATITLDDMFMVHNIKIIKLKESGKISVVFPFTKTKSGNIIDLCEIISNRDEYYNQILDAYYKKIQSSNISDNHKDTSELNAEKKVDNSLLKKLIAEATIAEKVKQGELVEEILKNVAMEAKLLSYVEFSKEPTRNADGTVTIDAGTKMTFPPVTYGGGKQIYFPAYTDWEELRKNRNIPENPSTMTFGFDDYASFILDNGQDNGLVINPYSEHPFFISRSNLQYMRETRNKILGRASNQSNVSVKGYRVVNIEQYGYTIDIPNNWEIEGESNSATWDYMLSLKVRESHKMTLSICNRSNEKFEVEYDRVIKGLKAIGTKIICQNVVENKDLMISNLFIETNNRNYIL